jgi:hypothetical protein
MRRGYAKLGLSGKTNVTACGPRYHSLPFPSYLETKVELKAWAATINAGRRARGDKPYDYVCWFTAGGKKLTNQPLAEVE